MLISGKSLLINGSGASFWNAFTTGKSQSMGGIPHDIFGMTTRSVHQYVLGIYRKLGLEEKKCTKLQIGGPDGDLGSNEIKLSSDKTIGIVDGSGVLFDPTGIDREELLRLANARKMVSAFNKSKLSPKGFYISIEDSDITLPGIFPSYTRWYFGSFRIEVSK
jgi:glutamate dehydrogenase